MKKAATEGVYSLYIFGRAITARIKQDEYAFRRQSSPSGVCTMYLAALRVGASDLRS